MKNMNKEMMKKKDEKIKFSESVSGKNIPANDITEKTGQKRIKFNKNDDGVNTTPGGLKHEKIMVNKSDFKSESPDYSTNHKYLGRNYHEYQIDELHQKAGEIDLDGRSKMNKEDLIQALFQNHTKDEVYEIASEADISGRSNMSKNELINALRNNAKNTPNNSGNSGSSSKNFSQNTTTIEYYKRTKEELYEVAKKKNIDGRSNMNKDDLLEALYQDHTREELYEMAKREEIKGRSDMTKSQLIRELQTI